MNINIPAKYRKLIYPALAAALALSFIAGLITPDEVDTAISQAERIVTALSSLAFLLAAKNTPPE